ncbi:MAG: DUF4397 domain-containing protein [Nannocystaceae bacterium]
MTRHSTLLLALALGGCVERLIEDSAFVDSQDDGTDGTDGSDDGPELTTGIDPGADDDPATTSAPDDSGADSSGTVPDPPPESRVRVMHLGVFVPPVDVFANGAGPVFADVGFRTSSSYAEVPAGPYVFDVVLSGSPPEQAVLSPELNLAPATAYTAVAVGDLTDTGDTGIQILALVDDDVGIDSGTVRITVIHAAPAVGQVDVLEVSGDPIPLVENLDFAGATTLPDLPAIPFEIGLDVNDDSTADVTFRVDTTPLAGQQVNLYANNDELGGVVLVAQLGDGTTLTIPPS